MDTTRILSIVLLAVLIAGSLFMSYKKRSTFNKLQTLLVNGKYDEFFALIDSRFTCTLYPEYNRLYFKLNAYLLKGDDERALELLDSLLSRRMSRRQREDLVIKAFNIYVGQEDRTRSKAMLDEIKGWEGERYKAAQDDAQQMYDIMILHKSSYIERMREQIEQAEGIARGRLEYLVALQYHYQGNEAEYERYLQLSANDSFPSAQVTLKDDDAENPADEDAHAHDDEAC